ncbi:MAG: carbon-nitrogen hydrolase family protein [Opitutaceae bacterium]|nr:carbon-nitrogen hydrolase family protein [Opitutaceae bacterium]
MKLHVAGLQMPVGSEISVNARLISEALKRCADERAEILLTPEGSLSGYRPDFDAMEMTSALTQVTALARRLSVGLALGTCFREADGKCYNQVRFYRPDGEYLGFHSKILLCSGVVPRPEDEINHYAVRKLRTFEWARGVTFGALICNDLWGNPYCTPMPDDHLTQRLAEKGARVIFHAVNGGRDSSEMSHLNWQYHEANLRMRAGAGDVWIVTADNAAPVDLRCSAPSGVIAPNGAWACQAAPQGLQLFFHTIDLDCGGARAQPTPSGAPQS